MLLQSLKIIIYMSVFLASNETTSFHFLWGIQSSHRANLECFVLVFKQDIGGFSKKGMMQKEKKLWPSREIFIFIYKCLYTHIIKVRFTCRKLKIQKCWEKSWCFESAVPLTSHGIKIKMLKLLPEKVNCVPRYWVFHLFDQELCKKIFCT